MTMISSLWKWVPFVIGIIAISSCATPPPRTSGPIPGSPEEFVEVYIDSIPSGADVYEMNPKDGTLGGKLGVTPYLLRVGFATAKWHDTGECRLSRVTLWGSGCSWAERRYYYDDLEVLLNLALLKDGYYPSRIKNKSLFTLTYRNYPPKDTRITIPLRPSQARQNDVSHPAKQQQQQQQQTVVVPGGSRDSVAAKGTVIVTCEVQDAEVAVDGAFVGNAPANLKLTEGIHIIEVNKTGFKTYRKELRVLGGSELTLRVKLNH